MRERGRESVKEREREGERARERERERERDRGLTVCFVYNFRQGLKFQLVFFCFVFLLIFKSFCF